MMFNIEYVMPFGANNGYSLKIIYQYVPTYIEWLIKYIPDFEINLEDFRNLPIPTIPNPQPTPSQSRLKYYPAIKIETSVQKIVDYINAGGIIKEIDFHFSNATQEILELKQKGQYTSPEYLKSIPISSEELDIMLYTLEGIFYKVENTCIDYFRFYRDKTVINASVAIKKHSDQILNWFTKENSKMAQGKYTIYYTTLHDYFSNSLSSRDKKLNTNSKISFGIVNPFNGVNRKYSGEIVSKNEIILQAKNYKMLLK